MPDTALWLCQQNRTERLPNALPSVGLPAVLWVGVEKCQVTDKMYTENRFIIISFWQLSNRSIKTTVMNIKHF